MYFHVLKIFWIQLRYKKNILYYYIKWIAVFLKNVVKILNVVKKVNVKVTKNVVKKKTVVL